MALKQKNKNGKTMEVNFVVWQLKWKCHFMGHTEIISHCRRIGMWLLSTVYNCNRVKFFGIKLNFSLTGIRTIFENIFLKCLKWNKIIWFFFRIISIELELNEHSHWLTHTHTHSQWKWTFWTISNERMIHFNHCQNVMKNILVQIHPVTQMARPLQFSIKMQWKRGIKEKQKKKNKTWNNKIF